jgi:large subunit ribosomal protein L9
MRIILKEDVKDLGHVGDVVNVAEGYGRNYLLPRKMGVLATAGNMKDHDKRIKAAEERQARERQESLAVLDRVRGVRLTLTHRAAEGSTRLHGSITPAEIAEKLNAAISAGRPVDRRAIELRDPIRTLGEHTVTVRMGKGMTAQFVVDVQDENAAREAAAAAAATAAAAAAAAPAPESPVPAAAPTPEVEEADEVDAEEA